MIISILVLLILVPFIVLVLTRGPDKGPWLRDKSLKPGKSYTFIEMPVDEYGNNWYTVGEYPLAISAIVEPKDYEYEEDTYGAVADLRVVAPESFLNKWPTVKERTITGNLWIRADNLPWGEFDHETYINRIEEFIQEHGPDGQWLVDAYRETRM